MELLQLMKPRRIMSSPKMRRNMESIPIVSFNFSSKYGHFRRPYSNVSSFSYPFPPRTAIVGLLGAILGIKKEKVSETFSPELSKIGLSLNKQIETFTHVSNFRQTSSGDINYSIKFSKKSQMPETSNVVPESNKVAIIPMELLRNPSYLVYVSMENLMDEFVSRLKTKRYVYTPCMGLSEFLSQVQYVSDGYARKVKMNETDVSTVVSKDDCSLWVEKISSHNEYYNIQELKVPYFSTPERLFNYKTYIVNWTSSPIPVKMKNACYKFEDRIITFL